MSGSQTLQTRADAVTGGGLKPRGYQQITSLSTATGLTVPVVDATVHFVIIEAEDQNVRWRDDGTNPTATVGMTLISGDTLFYTGDPSAIKFIEETTSAKLNVSYYGGTI